MRRDEVKAILAPIRKGSFILCVDTKDCKWAIYQSKLDGSDFHCEDKQVVFTDEPYDLPDEIAPLRYKAWHSKVISNRYDYDIEAISVYSVRGVFQNLDDAMHVIEQLRAAEEAYVAAVEPHRARFAVLAKLLQNA